MICPMCSQEDDCLYDTYECGEVCQSCIGEENLTCPPNPDDIRERQLERERLG